MPRRSPGLGGLCDAMVHSVVGEGYQGLRHGCDRATLPGTYRGRDPMTFVLGILAVLALLLGAGVSATAASAMQETVGGLAILTAAVLFVGAAVVQKLSAIDRRPLTQAIGGATQANPLSILREALAMAAADA